MPKFESGNVAGVKGGKARAESLSPEERQIIARRASQARWSKAKGEFSLSVSAGELPMSEDTNYTITQKVGESPAQPSEGETCSLNSLSYVITPKKLEARSTQ